MRLPIEGVYAAILTLIVGALIALFFADYAVAEPNVRRQMRHRAAVGMGAVVGLVALTFLAVWFILAAFVAEDGCAWVAGVGGCLPK